MAEPKIKSPCEIEDLVRDGMNATQIGAELGVSRHVIQRAARRYGLELHWGHTNKKPIEQLRARVEDMTPLSAVDLLMFVIEGLIGEGEVDPLADLDLPHIQPKPRAILAFLMSREGRVCTYDQILEAIYLGAEEPPSSDTLKVYVSQLRKNVRGVIEITTHWDVGYSAQRVDPVNLGAVE